MFEICFLASVLACKTVKFTVSFYLLVSLFSLLQNQTLCKGLNELQNGQVRRRTWLSHHADDGQMYSLDLLSAVTTWLFVLEKESGVTVEPYTELNVPERASPSVCLS